MKNKLENFPSVYYVSLEECKDRQENIKKQFAEYGITPTAILSKRFTETDDEITGKFLDQMNGGTTGCVISHLKAIRKWYEETDEDYAFFCEDDLSLETIEYWDFTWEEFIEIIPEDACCVQLLVIRKDYETFDLRKRYWDDWAGTAYIITRDYAKVLVENYCLGEKRFHLELPGSRNVLTPLVENVLFETLENVCYTIPLFVEDIQFNTTFSPEEDEEVNGGQKNGHIEAYKIVLNHWKKEETNMNKIETLLTQYSNDPENENHNFNLGVWYWNEGHTAPALSYFLRCAERAEDNLLAYEALLWAHQCYEKQGTRDSTARTLLQHAVNLLPTRPEAYFLLAKFHGKREQWTDAYSISHQGLTFMEKNPEPLKNSVGYMGEFALLYEKAVAGWWWGKGDETRNLFDFIYEHHWEDFDELHKNSIRQNLIKVGKPIVEQSQVFNYPNNFDWADLTEEDIVTIDREIVHEKVYRFWNDVKENDVVLDVGASVGAYTISILDQKPKKVYCVEPSKNLLKTLVKNCSEKLFSNSDTSITYINNGIVNNNDDKINVFGSDKNFIPITFKQLIEKYSITKIDYMKVDCEGGEYSIFTEENFDFIFNNVKFVSIEIHLKGEGFREKFKYFRDNFLIKFNNYKVMSCTRQNINWGNSLDITTNIFDDEFINNYNCEFMVYIKNNYELPEQYEKSVQDLLMTYGVGDIPEDITKYNKTKHECLRFKFPGSNLIEKNYSQAYQDMFVLAILNGKRNGTYLEIGAQEPFTINNTALLETQFDWKGTSIEIRQDLCKMFAEQRKNQILCKDATKINYEKLLDEMNVGTDIDYLQVDCEPSKTTFEILTAICFEKYRFAVITYEHDHSVDITSSYRDKSRRFLKSYGYELVVKDVAFNDEYTFEDWWVHPDLVNSDIVSQMKSVNTDVTNIVKYFFT